jgi:hypothetical protein
MSKGTNINAENDIALRKGTSALYQHSKERDILSSAMANPETKQAILDFIFSGNPDDKSPLENIRKGKK